MSAAYPPDFERFWAATEPRRKRLGYLVWLRNRASATDVTRAEELAKVKVR